MITRFIVSFFISLLFAVSNSSVSHLSAYAEFFAADTLIQMERTVCFGTCPSYELTIHGNRSVVFEGKEFVAHKGTKEGKISRENLNQLLKLINEINYMKIPSDPKCESWATDMPSVFLTIEIGDERNSITHYKGCRGFENEDELNRLEAAIDSLAGVNKWVKEQ